MPTESASVPSVGGLVLRVHGDLAFLEAALITHVAPVPPITRVPGAPASLLGVALHGDELVPVIEIGSARESLIVCRFLGENMGLVGGVVVGTGMFPIDGVDAVRYEARRVEAFDLASAYAQVHAARWGGRWGG